MYFVSCWELLGGNLFAANFLSWHKACKQAETDGRAMSKGNKSSNHMKKIKQRGVLQVFICLTVSRLRAQSCLSWLLIEHTRVNLNTKLSLYLARCWWCRAAWWSGSVKHPGPRWHSNSSACHSRTCSTLWHPTRSAQGKLQGPAGLWSDTAASLSPVRL